jgi:hypothetical protein
MAKTGPPGICHTATHRQPRQIAGQDHQSPQSPVRSEQPKFRPSNAEAVIAGKDEE